MPRTHRNTFEVYASRDCIDNSERNSLHWCIFALAIIYSIPGAIHVGVDKDEVRFSYRGFRYVFPTPVKSASIARAYDDGVLTKREIAPWRDTLRDPISVEPTRHRRPAKNKVAAKKSKKKSCTRYRSSRWSGRRI